MSDDRFHEILTDIEKEFVKFSRGDRIFIEAWVKFLSVPQNHPIYKKNRNKFAILLLSQLWDGKLEPPFNKMPKDPDIPQFPSWCSEKIHCFRKRSMSAQSRSFQQKKFNKSVTKLFF